MKKRNEIFSRLVIITAYSVTAAFLIIAPFNALQWASKPFAGFLVEQTLVLANINGTGWPDQEIVMNHPQQIIQIDGQEITRLREFNAAVSSMEVGQIFSARMRTPEGAVYEYPTLQSLSFPSNDLLKLFWLPYVIGLVYLLVGIWVYSQRMNSASSRAFSFFCVNAAVVCGLYFSLETTHVGIVLWTLAIAQLGGALLSLTISFPEPWRKSRTRGVIRYLPYGVSAVLSVWGLSVLFNYEHPFAYFVPWRFSYYYAAIGIFVFIGALVYRMRTSASTVAQRQSFIILWGSLIAFLPVGLWFISSLFGLMVPLDAIFIFPELVFFPLTVGIAILRYKLWDFDLIINKALVYGILSAVLIGIYFVSVVSLGLLVDFLTGESSPLVTILATLIIAIIFNPLRVRLQKIIDRLFSRRAYDEIKVLTQFSENMKHIVDDETLYAKLDEVFDNTFQPEYYSIWQVKEENE